MDSYGAAWSSGEDIYVKDTAADGCLAYAKYKRQRLYDTQYFWAPADNSEAHKWAKGRILSVAVCLDQWGIDDCTTWH